MLVNSDSRFVIVIFFTLNLVPELFKCVTVKCVCKLYPPLLTSTIIVPIAICTEHVYSFCTPLYICMHISKVHACRYVHCT